MIQLYIPLSEFVEISATFSLSALLNCEWLTMTRKRKLYSFKSIFLNSRSTKNISFTKYSSFTIWSSTYIISSTTWSIRRTDQKVPSTCSFWCNYCSFHGWSHLKNKFLYFFLSFLLFIKKPTSCVIFHSIAHILQKFY